MMAKISKGRNEILHPFEEQLIYLFKALRLDRSTTLSQFYYSLFSSLRIIQLFLQLFDYRILSAFKRYNSIRISYIFTLAGCHFFYF